MDTTEAATILVRIFLQSLFSRFFEIEQNSIIASFSNTVGNATFTNGTEWEGNLYNTTVDWIPAGVLLNATSEGFNHPQIALSGQPVQDGRVALLTIRQLKSGSARYVEGKSHLES